MINHPRLDELLDYTDSPYACVTAAAKRARQLTAYQQRTDESLDHFRPPLVDTHSKHPLSIALEEISQGKLKVIPAESSQ